MRGSRNFCPQLILKFKEGFNGFIANKTILILYKGSRGRPIFSGGGGFDQLFLGGGGGEQHINIVNRGTLQSFWFNCSCLSFTIKKDCSNNHLHTLSIKLIIVRF